MKAYCRDTDDLRLLVLLSVTRANRGRATLTYNYTGVVGGSTESRFDNSFFVPTVGESSCFSLGGAPISPDP